MSNMHWGAVSCLSPTQGSQQPCPGTQSPTVLFLSLQNLSREKRYMLNAIKVKIYRKRIHFYSLVPSTPNFNSAYIKAGMKLRPTVAAIYSVLGMHRAS